LRAMRPLELTEWDSTTTIQVRRLARLSRSAFWKVVGIVEELQNDHSPAVSSARIITQYGSGGSDIRRGCDGRREDVAQPTADPADTTAMSGAFIPGVLSRCVTVWRGGGPVMPFDNAVRRKTCKDVIYRR